MRKPFPTCAECRGTGRADRDFDDMPTSCRACDGAGVDFYAFDARLAASSREDLRYADGQLLEAAWKKALLTHPDVDVDDWPDGWTHELGDALYRTQKSLVVAILEREGSPALTYVRALYRLPLESDRFPKTPWLRPAGTRA